MRHLSHVAGMAGANDADIVDAYIEGTLSARDDTPINASLPYEDLLFERLDILVPLLVDQKPELHNQVLCLTREIIAGLLTTRTSNDLAPYVSALRNSAQIYFARAENNYEHLEAAAALQYVIDAFDPAERKGALREVASWYSVVISGNLLTGNYFYTALAAERYGELVPLLAQTDDEQVRYDVISARYTLGRLCAERQGMESGIAAQSTLHILNQYFPTAIVARPLV